MNAFAGSNVKAERARRVVAELEAELGRFVAVGRRPAAAARCPDRRCGSQPTLCARSLGVAAGLATGGEPDWRTQFPIFSTEAAYDPKSLRQTAGMAAADARKLPALQPFHDVARSWRCARHHSHGRPLPPRGSALSPELRARGAAEAILEGTAPVCPSIASRLVLPHSGEAGCRN
jgi:hypothetical protein